MTEQYKKGDRVRIKSGSYVNHLYGTFLDNCGSQKVCVKVDNDNAVHRRLMKKSIRHVTQRDIQLHGPLVHGAGVAPQKDRCTLDDSDINSLLNDLASLKEAIEDIELKIKAYKRKPSNNKNN